MPGPGGEKGGGGLGPRPDGEAHATGLPRGPGSSKRLRKMRMEQNAFSDLTRWHWVPKCQLLNGVRIYEKCNPKIA